MVNSPGDAPDSNVGDNLCDTGSLVAGVAECTLRAAITQANATLGADQVDFNINPALFPTQCPGAVLPCTISTTGMFPGQFGYFISGPVTVDGYTQPGASPNTNPINQPSNAIVAIRVCPNPCSGGSPLEGFRLSAGSDGSTIRGLDISGFGGAIAIDGSANNYILGNLVHNNGSGIAIQNDNATGNQVGDHSSAGRNVIYSNDGTAIILVGSGMSQNAVLGNHIGLSPGGAKAGNGAAGVILAFGAMSNTIGDSASGGRNVISNNGNGVVLFHAGLGNAIQSNFIGTNLQGSTDMGNIGAGVLVQAPFPGPNNDGSLIGGLGTGDGNVIAFNGDGGVEVDASSLGVLILGNSIHDNRQANFVRGLGIDLGIDGVTPNDQGDNDSGANDLQNFPVITAAAFSGGNTSVSLTLNSLPSRNFRIEVFANDACDSSGFGEGQTFFGVLPNVATDAGGNASPAPLLLPFNGANKFLTATATLLNNGAPVETSEFSACVAVTSPSLATSTPTPTGTPAPGGTPTPTSTPIAPTAVPTRVDLAGQARGFSGAGAAAAPALVAALSRAELQRTALAGAGTSSQSAPALGQVAITPPDTGDGGLYRPVGTGPSAERSD